MLFREQTKLRLTLAIRNIFMYVTSFSYVLLRLIGKHDRIRTAPTGAGANALRSLGKDGLVIIVCVDGRQQHLARICGRRRGDHLHRRQQQEYRRAANKLSSASCTSPPIKGVYADRPGFSTTAAPPYRPAPDTGRPSPCPQRRKYTR